MWAETRSDQGRNHGTGQCDEIAAAAFIGIWTVQLARPALHTGCHCHMHSMACFTQSV